MVLDKNKGEWFTKRTDPFWVEHKPKKIDDYAYHLYLNDINQSLTNSYKVDQNRVMYGFIMENKFKKFYILAEQIIRKEKIDKIIGKYK